MMERFDTDARRVFLLAGELAAARGRRRVPHAPMPEVEITVGDLRRAIKLLGSTNWHGRLSDALTARMRDVIPKHDGPITVDVLQEVVSWR